MGVKERRMRIIQVLEETVPCKKGELAGVNACAVNMWQGAARDIVMLPYSADPIPIFL